MLKELDLPILTNEECEASYKKAGFWEEIPDIFICAGHKDGRKDTCEVGGWILFPRFISGMIAGGQWRSYGCPGTEWKI